MSGKGAKLQQAYKDVVSVARPSASEGLKKERSILLLWALRNVMGVDDLEAYEYVCDGDNDQGIDGLLLEQNPDPEKPQTLVLLQSKYPEKFKNVGVNELKQFVGSAQYFKSAKAFKKLLEGTLEPELKALLGRFEVEEKLSQGHLPVRLVFVTAGAMTPDARRYAASLGSGYLALYDVERLAPIVRAFRAPTTVAGVVKLACPATSRFIGRHSEGRVAICAVKASDIIKWPGIEDRNLFDLNVRRELRPNTVRAALDRAIQKAADHPNFLAFHNGLTVVCERIDDSDTQELLIENMSVVNGAQSTVALYDNASKVTDDLNVLVKFVEVSADHQLAREVAVRSNTQNPVTTRNLRARDGVQLRLEEEFRTRFPRITYETRPDYSNPAAGKVIANDLAAQLLCAIFNERPWLAVKRLALFDSENYPNVFHADITAEHIVLADRIGEVVQSHKALFPEEYQRSWQLTKVVAVYLVGQMCRTTKDLRDILLRPGPALARKATEGTLDELARMSAAVLRVRCDSRKSGEVFDDFKVEFKREAILRELGKTSRDRWLTYKTMRPGPSPEALAMSAGRKTGLRK